MADTRASAQVLLVDSVWEKLRLLPEHLKDLLNDKGGPVPDTPGRDVQIVPIRELPPKKGLSSAEGQARLLHDLASIELQAMELGVRTLIEFPHAPREFRDELAKITVEEGVHLRLCLEAMAALKFPWGTHPVHVALWQAVSHEDSLLDRILIVHRYLEGSGLDASDTLLRRFDGVRAPEATLAVKTIRFEEEAHVEFGSRWYRRIAEAQGIDPDEDFEPRLKKLFRRIPRRMEPISRPTRLAVGFTNREIDTLEDLKASWAAKTSPLIHQTDSSERR